MVDKKYYRCTVCGDIHWGKFAPEICPTCQQKNVYVEVEKEEVKNVLEL